MEQQFTFEIDPRNWAAEIPQIIGDARTFLVDLCQQARQDRVWLNDKFQECYNVWDLYPQIKYYDGRANVYLPAGQRVVEKAMGKLMARLFPSGDDFFDVKPVPEGEDTDKWVEQQMDAAKALAWYNLHVCMKIRQLMPIWLRQFLALGTSPLATDYISAEDVQGRSTRQQITLRRTAGGGIEAAGRPRSRVGPTARVVDLFTWYVWPPTVDALTEAVIVFEDQLVTKAVMEEWRKLGRYSFTDEELKSHEGQAPDHSVWQQSERLSRRGASSEAASGEGLYVVTTAYADWFREGDKGKERVACQFALLNDDVVLMARQNQSWDQEPPYDWARMGRWPGEAYGRGLIHAIRELQYQLNDLANLTLDTQMYALMPPAAVDPAIVQDPSILTWRPGARWPVPPNAIKWLQVPDTHRGGWESIRQIYEMIQESSGAATGGQYLPTLGIARGADTATGQQLLVQQADIDVALLTGAIEEEALEPLLHRLDSREQQFLPIQGERILRALGRKGLPLLQDGMRVRREQMAGTRTYTWTGSHISEQREALQKAGPGLLKIASQLAALPDGKIDLLGMFEDLYRSYGFSNAGDRIKRRQVGLGFDPQLEHMVLRAGHPVAPMPGENHQEHLTIHNATLPLAIQQGWGDGLKRHMLQTIQQFREDLATSTGPTMPNAQPPGQPPGVPGNGNPLASPVPMMAREGRVP